MYIVYIFLCLYDTERCDNLSNRIAKTVLHVYRMLQEDLNEDTNEEDEIFNKIRVDTDGN